MNLQKLILINNECYKIGRVITPKGLLLHSTGANNPWLRRYVGPDDGLLGDNRFNNHWNQHRPDGRQVCVHAFIGRLADGSIATYQTLPWNMRGWHGGSGPKGSVNDSHIGIEICEDGLADFIYFNAVYKEAVELCVYLCKLYGFSPDNIIGHYEGHRLGIANNHADPGHWFPRHGKSMDTFRADVKSALDFNEQPYWPDILTDGFYRVRKSWNDVGSQIGAFRVLLNARNYADANEGYSVFSNNGELVYYSPFQS